MEYEFRPNTVVIKNINNFDINQIFDCGQCFRFEIDTDGSFTGVAFNKVINLSQTKTGQTCDVRINNTTKEEFFAVWESYLGLKSDYAYIKNRLLTDETMQKAAEYSSGIRILHQDFWECLISFIVSQNNNIPRIKKIIEAICERTGEKLDYNAKTYYAFPNAEQLCRLTKSDLKALGAGYRDEYIYETANKVALNEIDLEAIRLMPTPQARQELLKIKGIGGKVADCILLFGLSRYEVCPHDVWVKRIFSNYYHIENINEKKGYALAREKWGDYAGIAQQYLFYYERQNSKK